MSEQTTHSVFVETWLCHEPALRPALAFVPAAQRSLFGIWGALVHALREAVLILYEPAVRQAKSVWWAEELQRLAEGAPQHPLTRALNGQGNVPWAQLAVGVMRALAAIDDAPADTSQALAQVQPLADALARVEADVFAIPMHASAGPALAVHLVAQRFAYALGDARFSGLPLHLLARHRIARAELDGAGGVAARRDFAAELEAALPALDPGLGLFRRLQLPLDRTLLQALRHDRRAPPAPNLRLLWQLWRAARV